ncbi:MAG: hypothetical protein V1827_02575 [Candidatus Micrarchaeota archaeon]
MFRQVHMRLFAISLLMFSVSLAANTTYRLDLEMHAECPGDMLIVDAVASNGEPAPDVELRLVLYEPYQGLRALKHTDYSGHTAFELTKNGTYRIYINTDTYNAKDYEIFRYPERCPPPPPKKLFAVVEVDCDGMSVKANVTDGGSPVGGVFARTLHWSSMSGKDGLVSLPLEEDDYFLAVGDGDREGFVVFGDICRSSFDAT